jgi:hypothetical protein
MAKIRADEKGNIIWKHGHIAEPRRVPLIRDTLGIAERAELARRAMAEPINRSPRLTPPPLADFDDLAAIPAWAKWSYVISILLVMAGIGVLIWASI